MHSVMPSFVQSILDKHNCTLKHFQVVIFLMLFGLFGLVSNFLQPTASLISGKLTATVFVVMSLSLVFGIGFVYRVASKKREIEYIFLCIAILLSIFSLFAFPPFSNPDGNSHFFRSFEVALGNFVTPISTDLSLFAYLPGGMSALTPASSLPSLISLLGTEVDFNNYTTYEVCGIALYSPFSVFPSALAIAALLPFTHSFVVLLYASRIANLCVVLAILFLAIKYMPYAKRSLALISLFPMSLEVYNSNSPDGITIAFAFLLISLVLHARHDRLFRFTPITISLLFLSMLSLSTGKIVYFPLIAMILLLPSSSLTRKTKKAALIKIISILLCAFLFSGWLFISAGLLDGTHFNPQYNIAPREQLEYVLLNPGSFFITCMNTTYGQSFSWFQQMIGSVLRMMDLPISGIYILSFILLLLFVLYFDRLHTSVTDKKLLVFSAVVFIAIVGAIYLSLYIQWTGLYDDTILGIQGRYFTPLLPLLLIMLMYGKRTIGKPSSENSTNIRVDVVIWPLVFVLDFCVISQSLLVVL